MRTSESTAALNAALAKAQKVIRPASFDRTNPHFKNKYATLPAIMEVIRGPLADNGIAILQGAEADGAAVKVTTRLAHASGEWIESTLAMTAQQNTPQGIMAALTYCRRGSLSLLCVVSDDDDDGEQASSPPRQQRPHTAPAPAPAPSPAPTAAPSAGVYGALWERTLGHYHKLAAPKMAWAVKLAGIPAETPTDAWTEAQAKEVEKLLFPMP